MELWKISLLGRALQYQVLLLTVVNMLSTCFSPPPPIIQSFALFAEEPIGITSNKVLAYTHHRRIV